MRPSMLWVLLCLFGAPARAESRNCEALTHMMQVGIREPILLEVMGRQADPWTRADVECLREAHAPAAVVQRARELAAESTPPVVEPIRRRRHLRRPRLRDTWRVPDPELARLLRRAAKRRPSPELASSLLEALELEALKPKAHEPHESEVELALAEAFRRLDLRVLADHHYTRVVGRDLSGATTMLGLAGLVRLYEQDRFEGRLPVVVTKVSSELFPRVGSDYLHLIQARVQLEQGSPLRAADAARQVRPASLHGSRAQFVLAVALHAQGRSELAIELWRELATRDSDDPEGARLVALSRLNLARASINRDLDAALAAYDRVQADSIQGDRARFEGAWVLFWQDRVEEALARLAPLDAPEVRARFFEPDVYRLRALVLGDLCRQREAIAEAQRAQVELQPQREALARWLESSEAGRLDKFVKSRPAGVGPALYADVIRDRDLQAMITHRSRIEAELRRVQAEGEDWPSSLREHARQILLRERASWAQKASARLVARVESAEAELRQALVDGSLAVYDGLDGGRRCRGREIY